jgi:signal transduction histidine kinase
MLRELGGLEGERDAMIARLAANARWVISLVSNYLDLSRIEADRLVLHSGKVELNVILQQIGEIYEDEARRKDIRFQLCLDPSLPRIPGDATALERVFGNLLHNALKYTPADGGITVRSERDGAGVSATVIDTGVGIAADEVTTIFDRYRRPVSGRAKHGSGLGLFIAKALVEAHGGSISVVTSPGIGSEFTVRLPLVRAE